MKPSSSSWLWVFPAAFLFGCSGSPVGPTTFGGAFTLVEFNGLLLPAEIGAVDIGFRGREGEGCRQHVSYGTLLLEPDFGLFRLEYVVTNSCTGDLLARVEEFGVYGLDGSVIRFRSPAIAEKEADLVFDGEIIGDRVMVRFFKVILVFQ